MAETEPAPQPPAPEGAPPRRSRWDLARTLAQLALSLGALVAVVALASYLARPQLDALGHAFVQRFGLPGMFAGVFLADALSFPIPPQFYMLTAITGGGSQVAAMATICAASVLAGLAGSRLAGHLAGVRLLARRIEGSRRRIDQLFERWGYWAIAVGSVSPIPFSMLCYVAGIYRMPPRLFAVLLVFRVPRLLVFYALIRFGWAQGG